MFKKIISVMLFTASLAISAPSFAAGNTAEKNVQSVLTADDISNQNITSINEESNVSATTTGWMLTLALVGFVMLSNRRAI